jgi:hypothetical protein
VTTELHFNCMILARLYNATILTYILYVAPFWTMLQISDTKQIRSYYFCYVYKHMLYVKVYVETTFMRNLCLSLPYKVREPFERDQQF